MQGRSQNTFIGGRGGNRLLRGVLLPSSYIDIPAPLSTQMAGGGIVGSGGGKFP